MSELTPTPTPTCLKDNNISWRTYFKNNNIKTDKLFQTSVKRKEKLGYVAIGFGYSSLSDCAILLMDKPNSSIGVFVEIP